MKTEGAGKKIVVTVYSGATNHASSELLDLAALVGRGLANRGWRLLYGGSTLGLMGACANAAIEAGGEVHGVTLNRFRNYHPGLVKLDSVETMRERKQLLAEGADAFIVLPGGLGTLEEAAEVANERSYKIHLKPLILLNHNNFWSPFIEQMQLMKRLGFIERPTPPFEVCATIDEMFSTLEQKLQEANKITKLGVK